MFCQNCGKEVDENDRFCKNCGVLVGYTREEDKTVQKQEASGPAGTQEQTAGGQAEPQTYASYIREEPQAALSKKTVTWIIAGTVAFLGLVSLIVLLVLVGAAGRNANPELQKFREQIEKDQGNYGYDEFFDYDFDEDDDDEEDQEDDYDGEGDGYFSDDGQEQGGEQFF